MTEALAPTPERLRKGDQFQPPAKDQKTDRPAWTALTELLRMLRDSEIEPPHFEAAQKFQKHLLGSLGFDVRVSLDSRSGEEPLEFPRSYHAQMLAKARDHLTPRDFAIVERLCQDESTSVTVGFGLSGYARRDAARPYGVSAINSALENLAFFWGFKRREPPSR